MNNWKVISRIAALFGITFIVFTILTAFINYQALTIQYTIFVPQDLIQVNTILSMLPYLLFAILSFIVAAVSSRVEKETHKNEYTYAQQLTAETTT
jgi:preprotein translocase subunit SecG